VEVPNFPVYLQEFSKELGVESWEYNQYASHGDEGYPPVVMRVEDIQCQIARGTLTHTDPKLWMIISLDRIRSLHLLQILTESLCKQFPSSMTACGFR
jgi:hypothetical protein